MSVSFQLPVEIEQSLRKEVGDLDRVAKEAAMVELYRQRKLTHHELALVLGLTRDQTESMLKAHGVPYGFSLEEVVGESESLRAAR